MKPTILILALCLAGCDEKGNPFMPDAIISVGVIAGLCFVLWIASQEEK